MFFNSLFFFATLAVFLAGYFALRPSAPRGAKLWVLAYSYFFYGMWNPAFLVLIALSTLVDYTAALGIARSPGKKRLWLGLSLGTNLGLLGFFKYSGLLLESAVWVAGQLGLEWQPEVWEVVLPVGISFYTFQTLSYTIDVYRGGLAPRRSLLDVAVYVAFFPQLVAGPILRAGEFLPQLEARQELRARDLTDGLFLIALGLFLKAVLADNASGMVDALFTNWRTNAALDHWMAAMLFGVQIHGDFSGYSLIAIGLARLMGYSIPKNFFAPYGAVGFSDFWRRWHISLSTWLRDYLYIPLGGNRGGSLLTGANLMATMLLGGLWHGASFLFVLWGAMHGAYLCVERLLRGRFALGPWARPLLALVTFLTVSMTWIPFRAETWEQCRTMLAGLFTGPFGSPGLHRWNLLLVAGVFAAHYLGSLRDYVELALERPLLRAIGLFVFLLSLYLLSGERTEFIYFQF